MASNDDPQSKKLFVLERDTNGSNIPINPKTGIPTIKATPARLLKKTFFIKKRKKDGKILNDYWDFLIDYKNLPLS